MHSMHLHAIVQVAYPIQCVKEFGLKAECDSMHARIHAYAHSLVYSFIHPSIHVECMLDRISRPI